MVFFRTVPCSCGFLSRLSHTRSFTLEALSSCWIAFDNSRSLADNHTRIRSLFRVLSTLSRINCQNSKMPVAKPWHGPCQFEMDGPLNLGWQFLQDRPTQSITPVAGSTFSTLCRKLKVVIWIRIRDLEIGFTDIRPIFKFPVEWIHDAGRRTNLVLRRRSQD